MAAVIEISKLANNRNGKPSDDFLKLRPFSVKEYDWMIEQGILNEDDNIELLNGAIVEKMPKGTKHANFNDIVLVEPPFSKYFEKHPTPADIFLILEVSDSTLSYDRAAKSAAYARAGICQYLLLNVQERTLEDYREPAPDGYQSKQTLRGEQTFNLVAFPGVTLQAKDFLPNEKI
jgi:Uma2 family endonuclease